MLHEPTPEEERHAVVRNHLRFGWWMLLLYLTLGTALEAMHGFKIGFYLDGENETRRLLWTLGHAHGTLLALLNIVFAVSLGGLDAWSTSSRALASRSLLIATLLVPTGFLLGGAKVYDGDPGLGILLVPIGAVFLFVGVMMTAMAVGSWRSPAHRPADGEPEIGRPEKRRRR